LLCDSAGNPIIAGYSHNGTDYDILLLKYTNTTGSLLWSNRYDGPGHGDEVATAIARDGSNSVVVTGYSAAGGGTNDLFTAKFAPATGSLLWERRYHGTGGTCHFGNAVACDTAGNVAVAGSSSNGTNLDWYVAKYAAASGTLVWEDRHKGTGNRDDGANAVAFDSAGNVVATGYDYNTGSNNDLFAVKYDGATGAVLWSNRYDGAASIDIGTSAVVDASNGVFVAGHSRGPDGNPDLYLLKYASATGAVLWQQRFTVSTNSYEETPGMRALTLTPDSGIAVAARTITNRSDYLTIKFAP
jgi:hypothetical protein